MSSLAIAGHEYLLTVNDSQNVITDLTSVSDLKTQAICAQN